LELLKIGFDHRNRIWSKFELDAIWNIWTVEPNVLGEMGFGYYLVAGIILVVAEES
jgi:hypothetical protein